MLVNDLLSGKHGRRTMSADGPPSHVCTFEGTTEISWERAAERTAEQPTSLQHECS